MWDDGRIKREVRKVGWLIATIAVGQLLPRWIPSIVSLGVGLYAIFVYLRLLRGAGATWFATWGLLACLLLILRALVDLSAMNILPGTYTLMYKMHQMKAKWSDLAPAVLLQGLLSAGSLAAAVVLIAVSSRVLSPFVQRDERRLLSVMFCALVVLLVLQELAMCWVRLFLFADRFPFREWLRYTPHQAAGIGAALLGALLGFMIYRASSQLHLRSLRCATCGYDRRGLAADATACPECGHTPPAPLGRASPEAGDPGVSRTPRPG